ncbi:succinylglutamate desuccinylase [Nonlabens spongiae]|uniref:Succinylglutamate desuccinylase n=1 Tax=Nonlabens spongiae TaxID=331648 RepID=A0A1W6MLS8_9FLAO|nr:succinylglutamate desuccinylase/aspartoacylase family protein [Nonlabens spongiae]ARN78555.1 succinylglutamate desuccinylase [Nonlabens spongiae]
MERIINKYTSGDAGPLVFITAAVHGNEPSGVQALEEVFTQLQTAKPKIKGTLVGLRGNLNALANDRRFIDEDLNRTWTKEKIEKTFHETREETEMMEIIEILDKELENHNGKEAYFLDCHTTSSQSVPYISVQVKGDNDPWAHKFPTYIVRGFSDMVNGSIDHYFTDRGLTGFTFEAGQHDHPDSKRHHESMIWLILKNACDLDLTEIATYPDCIESLENDPPNQKTFEIIHRHEIQSDDDFKMIPGFENFQKISKGELLAHNNGEDVKSIWDARIFMPLYQGQGNDGFFVIEEQ